MSTTPHRALVVEDEREAAEDLVEILKGCGCESVVVTNRRDALQQLASRPFCIIILDLEIGSEPDSIRGRVDNGKAVLAAARERFPDRAGATHALPIIVISGFASETEAAVEVMREGATDVVQKLQPPAIKSKRIYEALERSGRPSHARCTVLLQNAPPVRKPEDVILSIPGDRDGQRARVRLSERPASLTMASLKILLQLVEAHLSGLRVNKVDMGGDDTKGFKAISALRNDLKPAYAGDTKALIENDQKGNYWLAESVSIGEVNAARLRTFDDARVTATASRILNLLEKFERFPEKP